MMVIALMARRLRPFPQHPPVRKNDADAKVQRALAEETAQSNEMTVLSAILLNCLFRETVCVIA